MSKIEQVLERLRNYEERGDDLRARCPAHGGESSDSLSVREGEGGQVLLHCFHGCEFEDIMEALDLDPGDLAPSGKANGRPIGPPSDKGGEVLAVDELPGATEEYFAFQDQDGAYLYVQRHKGAYYRVVGFDDDGDPLFKKGLAGVEPVLFGLPELKEAIENGSPVVHTEGCKDALAAHKRLGVAGVTSGGTTSWKGEFAHNYEGAKEVLIVPDNDEGGYSYALQVAQDLVSVVETVKIIVLPDLPDKGDLTDWLDDGHTPEEFFQIAEATEPVDKGIAWPTKLAELELRLPLVQPFDPELLPGPLREWVLDVAKRMDNAAPDFVAAAAMVQAGSLLGRKVGMHPKRHDDWLVVPNLWGGLVGPPSSMKTPALEQAIKPLKRLAAQAKEAYEAATADHEIDKMASAAEKSALKKQMEEAAKKAIADKGARESMKVVKDQLRELEVPEEPVHRRYLTNDATIEKIAEILAENPDGILYYSDELMRFLKGLDRVGRESDRAFFLEAWNGNSSFEVDRISRGTIHVPALCIALLGGIQPGPLMKYGLSRDFGDRQKSLR